jgi:flagellar assembly protein FliH
MAMTNWSSDMSAHAKFLFDVDFAAPADQRSTLSLADHEAKCAAREAQAYQRGMEAAHAQIDANARQQIADALTRIGGGIEELGQTLPDIESRLQTEAVEIAAAIAGKLAPELIAREPFAEIAALVAECFQHLTSKPHVVVRVNDEVYESARQQIEEIARARSFEGRLVVLAEPDIGIGDCRIEWADGGIVRNRSQIEAAIGDVVARYLATCNSRPATGEGKPS